MDSFEHMAVNEIYSDLQSSHRQHHGTETALFKDMNDVLLKMNTQHVTLTVPILDLSAACDSTVDHNILLSRDFEQSFGLIVSVRVSTL